MLRSFLISLQFLTCIPVFFKNFPNDKELGHSILFYPVIGLLIGAILFTISLLSNVTNNMLTAAMILVAWVVITGGLHLDGLSDTVDAWVGGLGSRDRTLEIMKDPNIGPMGAISLLLILLLKFTAINTILINEHFYWLLISPVIARVSSILLLLYTPYARKGGLGEKLLSNAPKSKAIFTCLITTIIFAILLPIQALIIILSCIGLLLFWRYLLMKRLGGCTGDTIGALIETTETLILIILALY